MAIDPEPHLFRIISYFLSTKLFVSDLDPLAHNPQDIRHAEVDQIIGLLEEQSLPDDFRRAVPGYIKHHFYSVRTEERLYLLFNTLFKIILNATERRHSVLIYSRRPEYCTAVVIAFFLRAHMLAPHLLVYAPLQPIPKTRETYTLSYLHYLEQVYPPAFLTADLTRMLHAYERQHIIIPDPLEIDSDPEPEPSTTDQTTTESTAMDVDPWTEFVTEFVSFLIPIPPPAPPAVQVAVPPPGLVAPIPVRRTPGTDLPPGLDGRNNDPK
jgi:hypothetical protein